MKIISSHKRELIEHCIISVVACRRSKYQLEQALRFSLEYVPINVITKIKEEADAIISKEIQI
jgi:hypothetical protein